MAGDDMGRPQRSSYTDAEDVEMLDKRPELSDARITSQLNWVDEQLSKTAALAHELRDRLTPILLPSIPSGGEVAGPSPKGTSEVSAHLDGIQQQVMNLQEFLAKTLERIQL